MSVNLYTIYTSANAHAGGYAYCEECGRRGEADEMVFAKNKKDFRQTIYYCRHCASKNRVTDLEGKSWFYSPGWYALLLTEEEAEFLLANGIKIRK